MLMALAVPPAGSAGDGSMDSDSLEEMNTSK